MRAAVTILCLILLTGCGTITKTIYIEKEIPYIPTKPEYYSVEWQSMTGLYCIDEDNAINLLKNRELDKSYQEEIRNILENLKE